MRKVAVIGGGAAGMAAALSAAKCGCKVELFEQNEKLGKKVYITGKGRCNLTNSCDTQEFFQSVIRNPKFLYSAIYGFDQFQTMDFFNRHGCPIKEERGNRVFPVSDHASDVIRCLENQLRESGVQIHLYSKVQEIISRQGKVRGVRCKGQELPFDAVILATGGCSYESTGSTGDGYLFAESLGHQVTPRYPSLVPLEVEEDYCKELQGISLKNVTLTIGKGKKKLFSEFGELLFTHFGISGPLVLKASAILAQKLPFESFQGEIDLKPALSLEQMDQRLLREFSNHSNKQFRNVVTTLFPGKMVPVMVTLSGIDPYKQVNLITKEERQNFCQLIKGLPLTIRKSRGFSEAVVTCGGVAVKDINPSTMESKLVKGLFFAGELMDVDAMTGGYNLQIAWSTGVLAGQCVKEDTDEKF